MSSPQSRPAPVLSRVRARFPLCVLVVSPIVWGGHAAAVAPARVQPKPVLAAPRKPPAKLPATPVRVAALSDWESARVEIVAAGRGRINYEAGVAKAVGLGALAPPTLSRSRAQDTLDARKAAFSDALRTLALAAGRVRVTADTRVENLVLKSDDVRLRVEGVLQQAQVVEEALSPAGVYRIVVQVPLTGAGSLAEAVGAGDNAPEDFPGPIRNVAAHKSVVAPEAPKPTLGLEVPIPDGATYTGLVVDCRELDVVACMSPKLFDTRGKEVYGTLKVSPDYAIEPGIVGYPRSMEAALRSPRAGDRPLRVRAVRCADDHHFFPVIRREDAERIRDANQHDKFLERTAVVFVVDPL